MKPPMNADVTSDPLVAFYLGRSTDTEGRRLEDIWTWGNDKLEGTHDYIQWLFPLRKRSKFNPGAPTLTSETIDAFMKNNELRKRLTTSLEIMLKFYGLKSLVADDGIIEISKAPDFNARRLKWLTPMNHNFLRLTRILKSLQILGLSNWAHALFACLNEIYHTNSSEIGAETFAYWKAAASP
ncbi:MAG: opioid growth factor receptor-related protein [Methanothrix sp.]